MSIKHISELEGLRGVSILLVFLSHAWMRNIIPGGLGVTIFFFISGYIITMVLLREFTATQQINIYQFYVRRWFRLMPALFVYLIVSAFTQIAVGVPVGWTEIMSVVFYFANYYGIYRGFSDIGMMSPYNIAWSLSVEEHFYMLYPLLCSLMFVNTRYFLKILCTSLLVALMWRCYLVYGIGLDSLQHYRLYKATDTRFDSIVYGVIFAMLSNNKKFIELMASQLSLVVGFLLMALTLVIRDENFRESFRYSVQGLGLLLIFQHLLYKSNYLKSILRIGFLTFIGRVSYSLYLYHWLAFVVIDHYFKDENIILRMTSMIILSIVLATLSFYYVERPGLKFGMRFRGKSGKIVSA